MENKQKRQPVTGIRELTPYYATQLHDILTSKMGNVEGMIVGGRIDTKRMADRANVCRYTVYRWFQADELGLTPAKKIINMSYDAESDTYLVTKEDLLPLMGL